MELSTTGGCPPLEVRFGAPAGYAENYRWDFGDGRQSREAAPSVTFSQPGNYPVRLIVANACGADTLTQTVQVLENDACEQQISGRLIDAASGEAIGNTLVLAYDPEAFGSTRPAQRPAALGTSRTDPDGFFQIPYPGRSETATVLLQVEGYADTTIKVAPDQTDEVQEFALTPFLQLDIGGDDAPEPAAEGDRDGDTAPPSRKWCASPAEPLLWAAYRRSATGIVIIPKYPLAK